MAPRAIASGIRKRSDILTWNWSCSLSQSSESASLARCDRWRSASRTRPSLYLGGPAMTTTAFRRGARPAAHIISRFEGGPMLNTAMRLLARERGLFAGALIAGAAAAGLGVPVDFILFALTLAGVALF